MAAPIVQQLSQAGIYTPFPIQAAAIPAVLAGKDVLGRGPTGSGKTFTFGLPMLQRLADTGASQVRHPRGLVLLPTRELAAQVAERLTDVAAAVGLRVLAVYGGVAISRHKTQLARPVDLLIATPGRAQDLINQGELFFDDVAITCLDEADQMADMGFLPQVTRLLQFTDPDGQRLLFSATLDNDVQTLVQRFMHNPVVHETAPVQAAVDTMSHYQLLVGPTNAERTEVSQWIGARPGRTIMFMRTRYNVESQVRKLRRVGVNAVGIHGDKGQGARTHAITSFTQGDIPVLVATDIAARGIDIADVSLVVHVEPPAEAKAYVHRAGRTARGGATGTVVTLVTDPQRENVAKLLASAGVDAPAIAVTPGSAELARITGARQPSGQRLGKVVTPGSPPAKTGAKQPSPRTRTRKGRTSTGDDTKRRGQGRNR
ncbi:DEAD/DEAH box helicase [Corynebacterium choanae]|uniref:DEAD/DEAH box helicase n=1 Tax=Corynebacterium choanae TaxID=1862358 RepID=UPI000F506E03|nr:DEAD/DEAH box helicase [Corynebacterium choanae]